MNIAHWAHWLYVEYQKYKEINLCPVKLQLLIKLVKTNNNSHYKRKLIRQNKSLIVQ